MSQKPKMVINSEDLRLTKTWFFPCQESYDNFKMVLKGAQKTIELCIYTFNYDEIADIFTSRALANVEIKILFDEEQAKQYFSTVNKLQQDSNNKIQMRFCPRIGNYGSLHHKFVIIDKKLVAYGSLNYSYTATHDSKEDLNISKYRPSVDDYIKRFCQLWAEYPPNNYQVKKFNLVLISTLTELVQKINKDQEQMINNRSPLNSQEDELNQSTEEERKNKKINQLLRSHQNEMERSQFIDDLESDKQESKVEIKKLKKKIKYQGLEINRLNEKIKNSSESQKKENKKLNDKIEFLQQKIDRFEIALQIHNMSFEDYISCIIKQPFNGTQTVSKSGTEQHVMEEESPKNQ